MSKQQLESAIEKVAESLGVEKQEIANNLIQKDHWTWFLVRKAAE